MGFWEHFSEHFGAGWGKGFSPAAGRVLEGAVELAGNLGCDKADTGHLLLAILQRDAGAAGRYLEGKNIREPEVRRQVAERRAVRARRGGCAGRTLPPSCAGRWTTP